MAGSKSGSAIEWTDESDNVVGGCSHRSTGCEQCYAESNAVDLSRRAGPEVRARYLPVVDQAKHRWARGADGKPVFQWWAAAALATIGAAGKHKLAEGEAQEPWMPAGWRMKRRFFGSMAELYHPERDDHDIEAALGVLAGNLRRPRWTLVTKEPGEAYRHLRAAHERGWGEMWRITRERLRAEGVTADLHEEHVEPTIVLLTTVENQEQVRRRLPHLVKCRPFVDAIGISAEPLLEQIDLNVDGLLPELDWAIFGGESKGHPGKEPRECDIDWIGRGVDACREHGVAPFVKQVGANVVTTRSRTALMGAGWRPVSTWDEDQKLHIVLSHSKGGDMAEWGEKLRVREHVVVPMRGAAA